MEPDIAAVEGLFCPPARLKLPRGTPCLARRSKGIGGDSQVSAPTAAQQAGLRYEAQAREHLEALVPSWDFGIWWTYVDQRTGRDRLCQVDAFRVDFFQKLVNVVEIKKRHTSDSWWQLRKLYEPVLRSVYPAPYQFNVVEMCESFDPDIRLSEPIFFVDDLVKWTAAPAPGFGVYRWRP